MHSSINVIAAAGLALGAALGLAGAMVTQQTRRRSYGRSTAPDL